MSDVPETLTAADVWIWQDHDGFLHWRVGSEPKHKAERYLRHSEHRRRIEELEAERETGVTQFGDDWPGVFIRGDSAHLYAGGLDYALKHLAQQKHIEDQVAYAVLEGLRDLLRASRR